MTMLTAFKRLTDCDAFGQGVGGLKAFRPNFGLRGACGVHRLTPQTWAGEFLAHFVQAPNEPLPTKIQVRNCTQNTVSDGLTERNLSHKALNKCRMKSISSI